MSDLILEIKFLVEKLEALWTQSFGFIFDFFNFLMAVAQDSGVSLLKRIPVLPSITVSRIPPLL